MKKVLLLLLAVMSTAALASCAGSRAFERGEHYAKSGEWDLAVKEYREANKREPGNIEYRSSLLRAQETAANEHYKKARNFLKERKLDQAVVELQQSLYLNPTNAAIQSALKSVLDMKQAEEHYRASLTFQELGKLNEAVNELTQAANLDPESVKYLDALDKLQKKRTETEPEDALTLASDKAITLNFKNTNMKDVFDFLAKLSGINILFDEEVKAQPVTVFVKDVSFQYALNLLLSTNKLFMKKVSADTIIIIPKNKAKIDQYQDLMVKTFYINNAKAKEIVNLIRSMLDVKKVYVNEAENSITVRDTPEKLKLVGKIIAANDLKEAEVILDVEILEISRSNALKYGWNFTPSGLSASASIQSTTNTSSTNGIALDELRSLRSGNVFLTLPGVVVNLIKQDSDAQTLANPRVRVLNNKQAKFHIGDKIPVQTATVTSTQTVAVTSTFEYKDVGIKLNIEPTIHLNNTVTLKLNMEISTLGDALDFGNGQKQYKFGTRNTETTINLRDGETVIIGGLIKDEDRKNRIKVPILGDIPVIGKFFSSTDDGTIKTDILMSITPNIVRNMELPDKDTQAFWSGTEEAYDTKPVFVTSEGKSSRPSSKSFDKSVILESMAKREAVAIAPGKEAAGPVSAQSATGRPIAAASAPAIKEATSQISAPSMTGQPSVKPSVPTIGVAAGLVSVQSATGRPIADSSAPAASEPLISAPSTTSSVKPSIPAPGVAAGFVSAPLATEQPAVARSGPLLELKPSEGTVQVGQETRFDITADGMKDLYGAITTISYDPKVVELKTAGEGTLLKKDNQQTSFLFSNNIKTGLVDIYMTRIGNVGGVDGSGSLCTLVLQGKSNGTSEIAIKTVKLTNFKREQVQTEIKGAKVVVK